jgi:hypothetical protein
MSDPFTSDFNIAFHPADTTALRGCEAWPIVWCCDTDGIAPNVLDQAHAAAELIVWAALGRRHGICTVTKVVSAGVRCGCSHWAPQMIDGHIFNVCSSDPCGDRCCRLYLPHRDVVQVDEVTIAGEVLDPSAYALGRRGVLYSVDGCWPTESMCAESPIEVTYRHGIPIPAGSASAVGEVACEIIAACKGEPCRLPSRAVNVSRNGISIDLGDPQILADSGMWGMPILDALIRTLNPKGLVGRSGIASPDHPWQS